MEIAIGGKRSVGETDSDNRNRSQHSGGHATSHASAISLAAAADALDLAVEGCVFLAQRIVRVAQVLLVGHIACAWLAMTDRRLYHPSASAAASRPSSSKRTTIPAQTHPGRRSEPPAPSRGLFFASWFSRFLVLLLSRRNFDRSAIAASLGRAILRLSYIGHGAEQPEFRPPPAPRRSRASPRSRSCDCLHLPAAPVPSRLPPSSPDHGFGG